MTKPDDLKMEVFLFLNRLRESGETNMFGAVPFIEEEFGMERDVAKKMLTDWMKWASEDPSNLTK